ncbi:MULTISPECIES: MBL fold metallo-hydrolase RNA specificity domain-containing protein [Salinibaculum]|uniref:MBL fold metallo-hydrolase RNA specificity domain-containing protein n=1 Tax=Salinibaculum TaxID=2732368 RepID=UPI0030CABB0B
MTRSVRYTDGIEIDLSTGETVVADASAPDGDVNVVSHAHGDHLYDDPPDEVVWSSLTADLAAVRRPDDPLPETVTDDRITLVDAGHVPGSRAVLVEDADRTYLYTGDISTRSRHALAGFDPPEADVLVVESTYGDPEYVFPPRPEVATAFHDWLADSADHPVIVFAYSLGRAQEVQLLLGDSGRERVFVTEAIENLNEPIAAATDLSFPVERYTRETTLGAGDALVLPSQTNRLSFVESIVEETGALRAALSGWAVDTSFRYAGGYDRTFPLSDHCDFEELLAVVEQVDPEVVYTTHGSTDTLATEIRSRLGYEAHSLKQNQTSLSDF